MKSIAYDYFKQLCSPLTSRKAKIYGALVKLRSYFELKQEMILGRLHSNTLFMLLKKRREWILLSFRNYSLFLIWGSISLSLIRLFQIWVTGSWHLINFYYASVSFSFFITFTLIFLRYLKDKGCFKRGEQNREKWKAYQQFVAEKHKLKWNFIFSRSLIVLFTLDFLFVRFYRDNHVGETLCHVGMLISSFAFFCYFLNHCYLYYWMRKTPTPQELLLEPSKVYTRLLSIPVIERILSRRYGTRSRAERLRLLYNNNKKEIWATTLGFAGLTYWAMGTDVNRAIYSQETPYGARVTTSTKHGWYAVNPKVNERAHQLSRWGFDVADLCFQDTKKLDEEKVNSTYERLKDERYPKPYKLELQNLKSNLEATQSNLEMTKSELMLQREKNLDLERRLLDLERAKETENR